MVIFAASQRHLPVRSGETEREEGRERGGKEERREGREERERGERWREERRGRRKVRQRCDKIQMFHKPPTLMSGRRTLSVNV